MAYSSTLANNSNTSQWSIMSFPNRSNTNTTSTNGSSNPIPISAVANSVDSLSVAVESSTCTTSSSLDDGNGFPSELRNILNQVAHCGACASLSWVINHNNIVSNSSVGRQKKGLQNNNSKSSIPSPPLTTTTSTSTSTTRSTSNSDIIVNKTSDDLEHFSSDGENTLSSSSSAISKQSCRAPKVRYNSLKEAMAHALLIVLDRAYKKTGYTLSPAEKKKLKKEKEVNLADCAFCDRKDKLLGMLLGENFEASIAKFSSNKHRGSSNNMTNVKAQKKSYNHRNQDAYTGHNPPFTIQRVAEILYMPEHYYTQTHKLCNALEKLLLVTSTSNAFGGSSGGEARRRSNEEMAKDTTGKKSEHPKTKRRLSYDGLNNMNPMVLTSTSHGSNLAQSPKSDNNSILISGNVNSAVHEAGLSQNPVNLQYPPNASSSQQQTITATQQATLFSSTIRGRKDTTPEFEASKEELNGMNSVIAASNMQNQALIPNGFAQNTTIPNPPENMILDTKGKPNIDLMTLTSSKGYETYSALIRNYAVITPLSNGENNNSLSTSLSNMAGKGDLSSTLQKGSILYASLPSTLSVEDSNATNNTKLSNGHVEIHADSSGELCLGVGGACSSSSLMRNPQPSLTSYQQNGSVKLEFEMATMTPCSASTTPSGILDLETGRSSASTSDSESCDDVDDCASDRSDGSDCGAAIEPFTAARVMTLNRKQQQQQRREQYLSRAMAVGTNSLNSYDFRPPPDSEYQSGDSIDSMMAEDSGGSDSSSSDMTD